jgi:hypothetical protein
MVHVSTIAPFSVLSILWATRIPPLQCNASIHTRFLYTTITIIIFPMKLLLHKYGGYRTNGKYFVYEKTTTRIGKFFYVNSKM